MTKRYISRDPLVSTSYELSKDAAKRFVLTPISAVDKLLKASYRSMPLESFDDFINRLNFIPA